MIFNALSLKKDVQFHFLYNKRLEQGDFLDREWESWR